MNKNRQYLFPFILITSLFFLWGLLHNLEPILIPHLKKSFSLTTFQSSLVDSAVFIAYFLMAIPAGYLLEKFGYKNGIIIGLLLFATGCFLFIPSANLQEYSFFLAALFVIACGLTILETAANPYATLLGPPERSTQRLNLAQSFNGLAATLAPLIGGRLILTKDYPPEELDRMSEGARKMALAAEASTVKTPYLILGIILIVVAIFFMIIKLPEVRAAKQETKSNSKILHAFKHRHLAWAVVAQFFYVGAQVCIFSFFLLYAVEVAGIDRITAADYLGWGGGMAFMIGRFAGTFLMKRIQPERLLSIFATAGIILTIASMTTHGIPALYFMIGIFFFMSIMFPTIFALGIKDLGDDTKYGSSLIIMAIVGGAILPPVFGKIHDLAENIQVAYVVPLICFAVILYFGWRGYKVKPVQTI